MTTALQVDTAELHLGRSAIYGLLALAYAYPTPSRLERMRTEASEDVREFASALVSADTLAPMLAHLDAPADVLQRDFARVFTHTVSPDCPTYESAYSARDIFQQAQTMADVAGFYSAFGLKVGGTEQERADHVATELEFMAVMAMKHAYAILHLGPEQIEIGSAAQRAFLRDHLGRWAGSLGRRTAATARAQPFYQAAGELLEAWIDQECRRLEVGPIELLDEPAVPLPESDEAVCGGPAESTAFIGFDDIQEVGPK